MKAKAYKHVTRDLRSQIYALLARGISMREIARQLGLNVSTISREIHRNSGVNGYSLEESDKKSKDRKTQASRGSRKIVGWVKDKVIEWLKLRWSPDQISGRLKLDHKICISRETIYQMIRIDKKQGGTLYQYLRHKGKRYNKRSSSTSGRGCIPNRVDIDNRPKIVEKKKRIGDWEGDTIIGAGHQGVILTYVDRRSKYLIAEVIGNKTMDRAASATIKRFNQFKEYVLTITYDNGKEFAAHEIISLALDADCYFAKPYHSWERGLNEHTNGLIRQYLPKSMDLTTVSQERMQEIENEINNRPRKVLNYRTPAEVFFSYVNKPSVALRACMGVL
jgi:transposase, IS30 family